MTQGDVWRIFYGDGSEFCNADGEPWDAPRMNVQAIAVSDDDVGWFLNCGEDYFYFEQERGGWQCGDIHTMHDHLLRARRPLVLFGRMMTDAAWAKFHARVRDTLGPKQGWKARESARQREQIKKP